MANPKIVEYIKTNSDAGFSLDDIKQKLLDSDMSQEDVDEAVKEAGVEEKKEEEIKQPSEEAKKTAEKEEKEKPEEKKPEPGKEMPQKKQSSFKWYIIAIPLLLLLIMWAIFYFLLRS
jgi:hypothetical protein